ncbi:CRISPR-associated helicase Cas3' [Ferviditalea candida]|uniref:CRISPR-associated helicase Cas3 n=1 Tax=Ferviditalea candida TaxID=3108399 RepID=A0ABU5ZNB8_9BACL|nr:CRISPR-associated helicase Cas3' [Paenibacillaceae bacterium T2]
MEYYAHSNDSNQFQLLKDHLFGVAELCKRNAEIFGAGDLGYLAGLLHDVGKYSNEFQQRIRGSQIRVDHSTAGAQWITQDDAVRQYLGKNHLHKYLARLIAHCIAGHHGGLKNYGTVDQEGTLAHRLSEPYRLAHVKDWSAAWNEVKLGEADLTAINQLFSTHSLTADKLAWRYAFLGRMLFSCLVDADTIDTKHFCQADESIPHAKPPGMNELLKRLESHMQRILEHSEPTPINQKRRQILEACNRQSNLTPRIFSLTVPTGGGKTLSSLSFALKHAVNHGQRRIIYVIPFTSIIEQNAKVFREAIGQDAVLEHHSNMNEDEYEENYGPEELRRLKLGTENWDAPVIVTTSVQFFESLFSNKRSKCRKLHNIANSVIIIDEAQSIPRGYMTPCLRALEELVESYKCTVVLCTATQPSWDSLGIGITEIMDDPSPNELMKDFKRVEVDIHNHLEAVSDEMVTDWLEEEEQILCIVNTRKHAKLLFDRMLERKLEGIYHLSGRMCARHRTEIFEEIRSRLKDNLPCRVVSTQLIEAGVDVDFPVVLRAMAGIDAIAQAAGRCNREGKLEVGKVVVFYPDKQGMPSKGWMKESAIEAQNVLTYRTEEPLSLECIQNYFERIHGICDGRVEQLTDAEQIIKLIRKKHNLEISYEDISDKFAFIDEIMQVVVIPYDQKAWDLINEMDTCMYPTGVIRKLQPYIVQIYRHELAEFLKRDLIRNREGVLYLTDPAYYHRQTGLLEAGDTAEHEVLIY